jgi:hypothetical protein
MQGNIVLDTPDNHHLAERESEFLLILTRTIFAETLNRNLLRFEKLRFVGQIPELALNKIITGQR